MLASRLNTPCVARKAKVLPLDASRRHVLTRPSLKCFAAEEQGKKRGKKGNKKSSRKASSSSSGLSAKGPAPVTPAPPAAAIEATDSAVQPAAAASVLQSPATDIQLVQSATSPQDEAPAPSPPPASAAADNAVGEVDVSASLQSESDGALDTLSSIESVEVQSGTAVDDMTVSKVQPAQAADVSESAATTLESSQPHMTTDSSSDNSFGGTSMNNSSQGTEDQAPIMFSFEVDAAAPIPGAADVEQAPEEQHDDSSKTDEVVSPSAVSGHSGDTTDQTEEQLPVKPVEDNNNHSGAASDEAAPIEVTEPVVVAAAAAAVAQEEPVPAAHTTVHEAAAAHDMFESSADDIKAALLDTVFGTDRGLSARSEVRAEINELISQLEALNPTPSPTEAMEKLSGSWRLVYSSSPVVLAVLALSRLPLVSVGALTQKVDSDTMNVENTIELSGPLSRTSFTTVASYEVRSPKRLQFKLEKGVVATPEITTDLDLPTNVSILGQTIDLTQLKDAIAPLSSQAQGLVGQLNSALSQVPQLNIPVNNQDAQTWQLNTYVDDTLRITRADGGAVFIYTRA